MEALCAFLLIACYFDWKYRRIPNWLLVIILFAGLCQSFSLQVWSGCAGFLLRALLLLVLLYPLYRLGMLGAGDVKLLGVCSGFFSYEKFLYFLLFSMLVGAMYSAVKMWQERNLSERFCYMGEYFWDVIRTGHWQLYADNQKDCHRTTIPLAGPVLISVLLHMGGVY